MYSEGEEQPTGHRPHVPSGADTRGRLQAHHAVCNAEEEHRNGGAAREAAQGEYLRLQASGLVQKRGGRGLYRVCQEVSRCGEEQ